MVTSHALHHSSGYSTCNTSSCCGHSSTYYQPTSCCPSYRTRSHHPCFNSYERYSHDLSCRNLHSYSDYSSNDPHLHASGRWSVTTQAHDPAFRWSHDMTLWTSFWDSFDSAIHQNTGLNEVDKFNYLRSLLRGSARDAVSGLMLTEANYAEAISVLKRRFGNKQQIIKKHMDILMNADAVTSPHNVPALRHFHDVVESSVRSLKALQQKPMEVY